ncbi:MAG: T9SS type A sorting domain-containing protein [Bacteroidales bacterium]|nr:T9SS type A sorting domain-containing protein [Bacteroidales bacterium]
MKRLTITLVFILVGFLMADGLQAQCTPGDSLSCPDPENNGEVCPDTLPDAIVNQFYQQEFTILAPPAYHDSATGITVDLHHIKILDVGNLPPGITWVSNTVDSVFMVGTYYCVLMEGTPTVTGEYPLEIQVEVYIDFSGNPILADTIIDSTSLAIKVIEESGLIEYGFSSIQRVETFPNPFNSTFDILFNLTEPEIITFEIYNLLGKIIHSETIEAHLGENRLKFDGTKLKPGIYFCSLSDSRSTITRRIIKTH